jgi:hypothetical protein
MKVKWINLFWGIILIAAGALFLAQNLGYLDQLELPVLMVVFAVVSLLFFVSYFIKGLREWGWLFPAFIFAALALVLWMQAQGIEGPWMGVPVLVAVALPFLVAFALSPRENWWALIPAWVMAVISAILIFAGEAQGEWIGALVLFSIGFPFLVVYLADRQNWWALIPAWTLLIIGLIVLLSTQVQGEWIAVLVLMGIALPFFVVYFRTRDNWWALIPAGVLTSSALSVFLAGLFGEQDSLLAKPGVLTGVTFLGIAATFFVLWLQRASQPTDWAIYAAGVAAVVALVSLLFGASQVVFPIAIIAVGILILYFAFRSRKTA